MANKKSKHHDFVTSEELIGEVASMMGQTIAGSVGGAIGRLVSLYSKRLFDYYIAENGNNVGKNVNDIDHPAPFLVIGLGRCGCHITAELAQMIAAISDDETQSKLPEQPGRFNWALKILSKASTTRVFAVKPIMLVGDIDETSFHDMDGLMRESGISEEERSKVLRLNYKPLTDGGAGHVPVFSEFVTRGLLLAPENGTMTENNWKEAKEFLTQNFSQNPDISRLVFYIFSSGGGTGSGAALEIMQAQRYAMNYTLKPASQIYFTGVAVLPLNIIRHRRHLINTGRLIIQYLANLNIELGCDAAYTNAPEFKTGAAIQFEERVRRVMPWEGLALISNDVMTATSSELLTVEQVEEICNQYMAQQIFNMAASQFPTDSFANSNDVEIDKENYQSSRLDPQDLKTSLVGPYGICYSIAEAKEMRENLEESVDNLILRAISLPNYREIGSGDMKQIILEGVSVAPESKSAYAETVNQIINSIDSNKAGITEEMVKDIAEIPMFHSCPRLMFVLTVPQNSPLPSVVPLRIAEVLQWLFPHAEQRQAIIRGTTVNFTLSIYVETSVILCPDVQAAVVNYLFKCWQCRDGDPQEFLTIYQGFINQKPPINDKEVEDWLGETEQYGVNIANFSSTKNQYEEIWEGYIAKLSIDDEEQKRNLLEHKIENHYLTAEEVVSASRYINYAIHAKSAVVIHSDLKGYLGK